MTREEKIKKRKERKHRRYRRRKDFEAQVRSLMHEKGVPRYIARHKLRTGYWKSWPEENSPTGYAQVCSYDVFGTCQSPCNGDC